MLCRLGNAWLFELQLGAAFSVGALGPAFGPWANLRPFHTGPNAMIGEPGALLGQLLDLRIQELFARWIQLQTTCAVGLRLHWSGAWFTRSILISHLSHCLTRDQHRITLSPIRKNSVTQITQVVTLGP